MCIVSPFIQSGNFVHVDNDRNIVGLLSLYRPPFQFYQSETSASSIFPVKIKIIDATHTSGIVSIWSMFA